MLTVTDMVQANATQITPTVRSIVRRWIFARMSFLLQDRMPHISYEKSNDISLTQDDRLHVSIYLRSLRVEAGSSASAQINPFLPLSGAGDEDLKRSDDTGNPF